MKLIFTADFIKIQHQQKFCVPLGASFFSVISPTKYGYLGVFYFHEVATGLMKVHFWTLSSLIDTSYTLKVIEEFANTILHGHKMVNG